MPIAALSENAARAICSSLVLNDSISVIKELIDNALDSHATNIIIETSANTLDIVQVKDNGTGIGIEDRQLLCKRGFTSKIRTLEDLEQLGGTFLGFRGEALASIAELSDSIAFTTRVDGETVGTQLRFDSKGQLSSSCSAAHGTGTTVRVSDFLKTIPVRRQTALKQAGKTLTRIKKLLLDYAFARPTVKFTFKVLKSKSELKDNWIFAPCKDASNLQVLTSKIVGKDIAAQCKQESISSGEDGYTIDAFMVQPGADLNTSSGSNRFFSIDGRPLTAERGVMKDLHKIYRSYLQVHSMDNHYQTGSQFLLLRLRCPKGTYDVNVEPAKNEVMLEDPTRVTKLFEDLCIGLYGEKAAAQVRQHSESVKPRATATSTFDVLLAKKLPTVEQQQTRTLHSSGKISNDNTSTSFQSPTGPGDPSISLDAHRDTPSKVSGNMYDLEDNEGTVGTGVALPTRSGTVEVEEHDDVMDPHVTNPFVLAKVNTRLQPRNVTEPTIESPHEAGQTDSESRRSPVSAMAGGGPALMPPKPGLLPSPSTSPDRDHPYQNPGPPNRPWRTRQDRETDGMSLDTSVPVNALRPTLLDSWAHNVNSSSPVQHSSEVIEVRRSEPIYKPEISFRSPMQSSARRGAAHTSTKGQRQAPQVPFRTPFKKPTTNMLSGGQQLLPNPEATPGPSFQMAPFSPSSRSREEGPQLPGFGRVRIDPSTELEDIMDFEHRKRDTTLQHRGKQPKRQRPTSDEVQSLVDDDANFQATGEKTNYASKFALAASRANESDTPPQSSLASFIQNPHHNRYKKAIRDLEERSRDATGADNVDSGAGEAESAQMRNLSCIPPKLSPNDPRAYLIRHQEEQGADGKSAKTKRTKTTKFPFETISTSSATFGLLAMLDASVTFDVTSLRRIAKRLQPSESYVRSGPASLNEIILTNGSEIMSEIESQVRALLEERIKSTSSMSNAGDATAGATRQLGD